MTGAEVLVIVQTNRERQIWASDLLKNQYESGTLAPTGNNEFANVSSTTQAEDDESLGVAPLESTPDKLPLDKVVSELLGHTIQGGTANKNVHIGPSLHEVLLRRPLPQLTVQEKALRLPRQPQVGISFISDASITVKVNARLV